MESKKVIGTSVPKSYQDECRRMRMHLVDLLARPAFGHRCWVDTLRIGDALIELDRQADSLDRESKRGKHEEITKGPAGADSDGGAG